MGTSVVIRKDDLKNQITYMKSILNERQYRCYLGTTALSLGRGGQALVSRLSGASINTVRKGVNEVSTNPAAQNSTQSRKPGGGRKAASEKHPGLQEVIKKIIDGQTYGDPEKIIHWTTQSLMSITKALEDEYGIKVSHTVVAGELDKMSYSKQMNQKMLQVGNAHPDRNAQFEYINETSKEYISEGIPVISIDCKKKENFGNFKNNYQEYRRKKDPRQVLDHDFLIKKLGTYGIYDIDKNTGFINLRTSHDTAEFAVNSILQWWLHIGQRNIS